jgi:hypothetical protein
MAILCVFLNVQADPIAENNTRFQLRPAVKAGTWYPGESEFLASFLDSLLDQEATTNQPPPGSRIRALIVPHAAYRYSAAIAANAYRALLAQHYERVIVIGPAHRASYPGLSILDVDGYQTPLGNIWLDHNGIRQLRRSRMISNRPHAHALEHSIELQLPFLQRVLSGNWLLIPILVGDMGEQDYELAGRLIRPLLNENTLLVISGDFTHYGPVYDYVPFPLNKQTRTRIVQIDQEIVSQIKNTDPARLTRYRKKMDLNDCAYGPVMVLLNLLPKNIHASVVGYGMSGETTGNFRNSVSYISMLFSSDKPLAARN